jgi:hypothetical protein
MWGSLLYDVALAYAGAWIFNFLVVVRPRRRDQRAMYTAMGRYVGHVGGSCYQLALELQHWVGLTGDDAGTAMPTRDGVAVAMSRVKPSDQAPAVWQDPRTGKLATANWQQWVIVKANRVRLFADRLGRSIRT